MNRLILVIKKNGKIITCINTFEWNDTIENIISQNMKESFILLEVPYNWLYDIKEWLMPIDYTIEGDEIIKGENYRDYSRYCDINAINTILGYDITTVNDIINDVRITYDVFKDSRDTGVL